MSSRRIQEDLAGSLSEAGPVLPGVWTTGLDFAERRMTAWFDLMGTLAMARHPGDVIAAQTAFCRRAAVDYGAMRSAEPSPVEPAPDDVAATRPAKADAA